MNQYKRRKQMAEQDYGLKMDDKVTVCDNCHQASCWQGMFLCEDNISAGSTQKTVLHLLLNTGEHPCYWRESKQETVLSWDIKK